MSDLVDVLIIGGGAAGLTAGLFGARQGLSVVVISEDLGGQAATTSLIENYPGIAAIDGLELMQSFQKQAEQYGARIINDEVRSVTPSNNQFELAGARGTYQSRTVIFAQGLTHRHLNIPGEHELTGKGVSHSVMSDGPAFKGKHVAVVGGGNSAMDAALVLSKIGAEVTLVTTNAEFRGEKILIDRVAQTRNITTMTETTTKEIQGTDHVTHLVVEQSGHTTSLPVQGVFVEIGFTVNPALVKDLVDLDGRHQIIVHPGSNATTVPGIFAAGDVTNISEKQVVISAGEGAKAALAVAQYLQSTGRLPKSGHVDWGVAPPHHHETLSIKK
ncbi:MAG: FAD-dependent oxidoreductase [Candidatus Kerfeldbacteria bacterium]|nr:FAD-dependent oxidoreductase [Candidatus Kerfeldbacteria bacterium]